MKKGGGEGGEVGKGGGGEEGKGGGGEEEKGKGGRGKGGRGEGESWFCVLHCTAIRVSFCSALLTNEIRFLVSDN